MATFTGKTALVTGASSGIGADLARELARRGANVILVARRADRLASLAAELTALGVTAAAVPCDLADPAARTALAATHPGVDILVNNAGLGVFGMFADSDWNKVDNMLEVNVVALTHLTHLFGKAMAARGYGRVLMVASTAAFQSVPFYAAYAATKAYVLSLTDALNVEFSRQGVKFTTLCPGTTESEFFDVAVQKKSIFVQKSMMTSAAVAKIGVDALAAGKGTAVAGVMNALMAFGAQRLTPRSTAAKLGYMVMKP
jgi:short-subunit dehydrogenase